MKLPYWEKIPATGQRWFAVAALLFITCLLYRNISHYDFTGFDDPTYITENIHVSTGLSFENLRWAFTSFEGNWHPLTWISHQLDVWLFGMNPGRHHLVNLSLHLFNTALLFAFVFRLTGKTWHALSVAAILALHPTHVESVAWISERKDLLSTFFFLLTLLSYYAYTLSGRRSNYLICITLYAAALLSKPMVVTLPFLLLLLDFFPLHRIRFESGRIWRTNVHLLLEKVPLLVMVVVVSVLTIVAQRTGGALVSLDTISVFQRIQNSLTGYSVYLSKFFLPTNLAVFYPQNHIFSATKTLAAALLVTTLCVLAYRHGKNRPAILTGWLWFLITLIPVIGLVQVGEQAYADRYTYIPYIGLTIAIAYIAEDVTHSLQAQKIIILASSLILTCWFGVQTSIYLQTWQNSLTLFNNAVKIAPYYHLTRNHLGLALASANRYEEALVQFETAISLKPDFAIGHYNKGLALLNLGRENQALESFNKAIELLPTYTNAYYNRALIYYEKADLNNAIRDLSSAQSLIFMSTIVNNIKPVELFTLMGRVYSDKGDQLKAGELLDRALKVEPGNIKGLIQLAIVKARLGNTKGAIEIFDALITRHPGDPELYFNLGIIYGKAGMLQEAISSFDKTLNLNPGHVNALGNRGNAYRLTGNIVQANADLRAACNSGGKQWCKENMVFGNK